MRRLLSSAAVVLVVVLLMTAPVSAQSGQLAVASSHTTASDFNSATTLDNVTVDGSGSAASVKMGEPYSIVDDTGDGSVDTVLGFVGDDSSNTKLNRGTQIQPTINGDISEISAHIDSTDGSDYGALVDVYIVEERPDGDFGEGTLVKEDWDPDWSTGDQSFNLDTHYSVDAGTNYTVEFVTQNTDNDGTTDRLIIDADDNSVFSGWSSRNGEVRDFGANFTFIQLPDRAQYISANHSVSSAEQGWVNRTLENASMDVRWEYLNSTDSTWDVGNSTTYTSSGNSTLDLPSVNADKWRLDATFNNESGATTAQLHDEGILVFANPPVFDNANPSPADGTVLSSRSTTLSIPVNDSDFASSSLSEQVTVEFFVQEPGGSYSSAGTDTLNSNGTASTSYSATTNGTHQWFANATDNFALENQSDVFTFDSPKTAGWLKLRPMDPTKGMQESMFVKIQATESENSSAKANSNQEFNLSTFNLPVDQEYVAIIQDNSNTPEWFDRRILLDDLSGNTTVYMLHENRSTPRNVRFKIEDRTGLYPPEETDLFVRRSRIYDPFSGASEFITATSEQIGANGFEPILNKDIRYRLTVRNDDGDTRRVGYFVPTLNETVVLEIEGISFDTVGDEGYRWEAYVEEVDQTVNGTTTTVDRVTWEYLDPDDKTERIDVRVYERNNESNVLFDDSFTGKGEVVVSHTLSKNQSGKAWVVEVDGKRANQNITGMKLIGKTKLNPGLGLSPFWQQFFAIATIVVIGAALGGLRDPSIAAIGVALGSGLFFFAGFFNGAVSGLAITVALFIAVLHRVAISGGGVVPGP